MKQRIIAVQFKISPANGMGILSQPTVLETYEGEYLTGIFYVTEVGNICLIDGTRFAKVAGISKGEDGLFDVRIELLSSTFKKGERRTEE